MAATPGAAETVQKCGAQPYYPSQYTCYDGFLCPVVSGERTLKCSNGCYLPEAYSCVNGMLVQHQVLKGNFAVHSVQAAIPALAGLQLNACGNRFYLSKDRACTYCPSEAAKAGACATVTNTTIFSSSSSMAVVVPGGQQFYVGPDGALGFTQAHSTYVPVGSELGGTVPYDHGYFNYVGASGSNAGSSSPTGWLACPVSSSTSGSRWQLFARRPGITFQANCIPVSLGVTSSPQGAYGAWQYT